MILASFLIIPSLIYIIYSKTKSNKDKALFKMDLFIIFVLSVFLGFASLVIYGISTVREITEVVYSTTDFKDIKKDIKGAVLTEEKSRIDFVKKYKINDLKDQYLLWPIPLESFNKSAKDDAKIEAVMYLNPKELSSPK